MGLSSRMAERNRIVKDICNELRHLELRRALIQVQESQWWEKRATFVSILWYREGYNRGWLIRRYAAVCLYSQISFPKSGIRKTEGTRPTNEDFKLSSHLSETKYEKKIRQTFQRPPRRIVGIHRWNSVKCHTQRDRNTKPDNLLSTLTGTIVA
jgi:hypothetical protein